ncbi:hypothetical protein [Streptomyces sp. NPDC056105]|uniref:hypothetical protein n=1 Tax=Streptomyces sp. NPDC056105 TaxID=3345714 RepID=UPI0035E27554
MIRRSMLALSAAVLTIAAPLLSAAPAHADNDFDYILIAKGPNVVALAAGDDGWATYFNNLGAGVFD